MFTLRLSFYMFAWLFVYEPKIYLSKYYFVTVEMFH